MTGTICMRPPLFSTSGGWLPLDNFLVLSTWHSAAVSSNLCGAWLCWSAAVCLALPCWPPALCTDYLLTTCDTSSCRCVYVFYSWNDSQAHFTIANNTARVAAGQATCARPCTDWAADISCCDDIYIPSFFFRWGFGGSGRARQGQAG